jgi:glycosyltransferase involved in cell wall biosynthesis
VSGSPRIVALVAARDEAERVAMTVEAIRSLPDVDEIVVVDDGSRDGTADLARSAGARVFSIRRSVGKGRALDLALGRIDADVFLLLDADLGASAKEASALLEPVLSGDADMTIGVLPRQEGHGGFRLVKRASAAWIRWLSGFRAGEPMSGQRTLTRRTVGVVRPLAAGFGLELGMTVDAVRAGLRVMEVPVDMEHAPTGRNLGGFVHRARQGFDHLRAALPRVVGLR